MMTTMGTNTPWQERTEVEKDTQLPNTQEMRALPSELDHPIPEKIQLLYRWLEEDAIIACNSMNQMTAEQINRYHEEPPHNQLTC